MDELQQVVLKDDLAGRHRDVLADAEGVHVGHLDRESSLAALEIVEQVLQTLDEVLAAAIERRLQDLGVGHQEVRGRHRIDELAGVEIDLARGLVVEPLDILHRRLHPARRQQIALLDEVEERIVVPRRIAEAAIALRRLDDRLGLAAEKALRRPLPEGQIVVPQRDLGLHELRRIGHHPRRHLEESGTDVERIAHANAAAGTGLAGMLALQKLRHQPLAALGDLGHVVRQRERIREFTILIGLLGHVLILPRASRASLLPPRSAGGKRRSEPQAPLYR